MEGGISEEEEFGTQTSGKQFEIEGIRSWERRAGPPVASFRWPRGTTAWREDAPKPRRMP